MNLRHLTGVRFVSRAPTKCGVDVELRVAKLAPAHVLWWQSHVQPIIDQDPQRADCGWNWLLIAPFSYVTGGVMLRGPTGYTVGIVARDHGHFVPCALALLLGRYRALDDHSRRSTFTWFLTTAPVEAMVSVKEFRLTEDRVPKRLGTITLDVAVTHSLNHRGRGRVGLYADKAGGQPLLQWYERRGMRPLPPDRRIPKGPRRLVKPSDGRYLYFTVQDALTFSHGLDDLR